MLQAAFLGAGEILVDPFRPFAAGVPVRGHIQLVQHVRQGQQRGHGVHVLAGQPDLELLGIVPGQNVLVPLILGPVVQLPDTVQPHTLRPFPVFIFAQVVIRKAVLLHAFEELFVVLIQNFFEALQILVDVMANILFGRFHVSVLLHAYDTIRPTKNLRVFGFLGGEDIAYFAFFE